MTLFWKTYFAAVAAVAFLAVGVRLEAQETQNFYQTGIPVCEDISGRIVNEEFHEAFSTIYVKTFETSGYAFPPYGQKRLVVSDCGLFFTVALPNTNPPGGLSLGIEFIFFFTELPTNIESIDKESLSYTWLPY